MAAKHKDIAILAKAHSATAIKTLAAIMEQPKAPEAARIKAAEVLLNRAHGLAKQHVDVSGSLDLGAFLAAFDRKTRETRE